MHTRNQTQDTRHKTPGTQYEAGMQSQGIDTWHSNISFTANIRTAETGHGRYTCQAQGRLTTKLHKIT
jgi:hypothetical protein